MKRISFKTISIHTNEREVTGYEVAPGIAVHKIGSSWTVTHISSGQSLLLDGAASLRTRGKAVAYVERLLKIFPDIDWQQDSKKVEAACRKIIRKHFKVLPSGGFHSAVKQLLEA